MIVKEFKYDIKNKHDMSLFGAFPVSDRLLFCLKFDDEDPDAVTMYIHNDAWNCGEKADHGFSFEKIGEGEFSLEISFDSFGELWSGDLSDGGCGLFYYHYLVHCGDDTVTYGGEAPTALEEIENGVGERQLLIYKDCYTTSHSFSSGVVYHIFVDRFRRSGRCGVKNGSILDEDWDGGIPQFGEYPGAEVSNNVFFGGDLYGITEKIGYIASLGTKTIYLSPIFDAYSNHKYDTADYLSVDEMFGGDDALRELCDKASEYGIDIILDGVFNHTGSDSIYFNKEGKYDSIGAYQSEKSPYYGWYTFTEYPDEYESWWGVKILPRVNSGNDDFKSFICENVVKKWMNCGVSGWRLDVADELDESFIEQLRASVKKENPDGVIIGEVWEDASDKVSYGYRRHYLGGNQLDSVMNYPLRSAVIEYVKYGNTEALRRFTEGTYRRYPKQSSDNLMNFLGTHDTERILSILGGEECGDKTNKELSALKMTEEERNSARERLKTAYGLIAGLPGAPCVFYGDEAGVEGYRDPFCRKPFPWSSPDIELTEFYRRIGTIRRENAVFRNGLFKIIHLDSDAFVYERIPFAGESDNIDMKIIVCTSRVGQSKITLSSASRELISGKKCSEFELNEGECAYISANIDTEIEIVKE